MAQILDFVDRGQAVGRSVVELSAVQGVPRSNVYYWRGRKQRIDAAELERDFFESEAGVEVLHRLYWAMQFVFVGKSGCGVDRVGECLRLSRMDRYVAASHGSVYQQAGEMEQQIVRYGVLERERLGVQMEPKRIAVCEDETFHPEMILVAMEPTSGFILVEEQSEARDADTWQAALTRGLEGLPVEVASLGSDQAKGLVSQAEHRLGVSHASDLMHGLYDLSLVTVRHLTQRLEVPRKALAKAMGTTQGLRQKKADYLAGPRGPGRPPNFDRYIAEAEASEQAAREVVEAAEADREATRVSILEMSDAYHLVDLETGRLQDAQTVERRMRLAFDVIDEIAERTGLSEKQRRRIDKSRRLVSRFKAHVAFAVGELDVALEGLNLAPAVLEVVRDKLVGGLYLLRAATKARSTEERDRFKALAGELLAVAYGTESALAGLDAATRAVVEATIHACFDLFVRSTACVEGRNGQLSLQQHCLHRLSPQRLTALTVIHNYHIQRPDGSTAAERFFGQPPEPLFEWLLANLDPPPRPRASRNQGAA